MISTLIAAASHPREDFTQITQLGLKAASLALLHRAALEPRLPKGTIDGLTEDLERLGVVVPGATQTHHEAQVATAAQNAASHRGYARIRAVRDAVKRLQAPPEVRKAYGVGLPTKARLVGDVVSGLEQILERAAKYPDEAAGLGIVGKDVEAMTAALLALRDADRTQESKRASAPLSTQERNRTANRITLAVAHISSAGGLEFAEDEEARGDFAALRPAPRKGGGKKKVEPAKAKASSSSSGHGGGGGVGE